MNPVDPFLKHPHRQNTLRSSLKGQFKVFKVLRFELNPIHLIDWQHTDVLGSIQDPSSHEVSHLILPIWVSSEISGFLLPPKIMQVGVLAGMLPYPESILQPHTHSLTVSRISSGSPLTLISIKQLLNIITLIMVGLWLNFRHTATSGTTLLKLVGSSRLNWLLKWLDKIVQRKVLELLYISVYKCKGVFRIIIKSGAKLEFI